MGLNKKKQETKPRQNFVQQ